MTFFIQLLGLLICLFVFKESLSNPELLKKFTILQDNFSIDAL